MDMLTEATFEEAVAGAEVPVLVEFWAEWCPPCRAMAPVLEEIAAEHSRNLRVLKVNSDDHPELAARLSVSSVPTLLVFRDGDLVKRMVGARGKRHLVEALAAVLS
ncbi:MAG: thioredoxin [Acidimicrobiia bacterium]|nr:thioredoxin [Acidimicrobiia bacterium]